MATIAVFDSHCARAYVTAEQDVAFLPYGLDVVENLEAVRKLKDLDDAIITANQAESTAAEALRSGDSLLLGTGNPVWKALFEAARKFSTEESRQRLIKKLSSRSCRRISSALCNGRLN